MGTKNTLYGAGKTAELLRGVRRVYLAGIGGISMASLARLALSRGFAVDGEDRGTGEEIPRLLELGIGIRNSFEGFPEGTGALVYSAAIPAEHPAFAAARESGMPVISRSDFLSFFMMDYPERLTVAGMHGKSTVTAMLDWILECAGRAPTTASGASLMNGLALREGGRNVFIAEACEYTDSFLSLSPTVALALNLELDHTDYFPDLEAVQRSFTAYLTKAERYAVLSGDDPGLREVANRLPAELPVFRFGLGAGNDLYAADIRQTPAGSRFSLFRSGDYTGDVTLPLIGTYNIRNALAAILSAELCGVGTADSAHALTGFHSPKRRMELRFTQDGVSYYDDYAHHPTEIIAALTALRGHTRGRLLVAFQSHTFSRTRALLNGFANALRLADSVLVLPVFSAREVDTLGITPDTLAEKIGDGAMSVPDYLSAAEWLACHSAPGDSVVVMGAGDQNRILGYLAEPGSR